MCPPGARRGVAGMAHSRDAVPARRRLLSALHFTFVDAILFVPAAAILRL